jgi:hypothetical protein
MENLLCITCKNYLDELNCLAFPDGIPEEILSGDNDHEKPLPEQFNGLVYTPKDTANTKV